LFDVLVISFYVLTTHPLFTDTAFSPFEWRVGAAAMAVGPLSALISTPFELVKTQMQININSSKLQHASTTTATSAAASTSTTATTTTVRGEQNKGFVRFRHSLHATLHIVRTEGVSALYKAHAVNTLREMVFLSTYFTVYEHLKVFTALHSIALRCAASHKSDTLQHVQFHPL
jgi:hypothetical protein